MTPEQALTRVAERTYDNTEDIRQKNRQRRHQVLDLYGVEYTRQGTQGAPATFYISMSPDMVYMERFEFKLIIQPFVIPIASNGLTPTSLSVTENESGTHTISPNPHTHNVIAGLTFVNTTASDFRVVIEGVDITANLMAQYDSWISGEGVYPSTDILNNYDILEVASDLTAEGRTADADKLTHAGYKKVQIYSDSPFEVTLVLYTKYSHLNR